MEPSANELIMRAIYDNDITYITCYLSSRGVNLNKICLNGMTLVGAAAQTGKLTILKALIEYYNCSTNFEGIRNENCCCTKPQYLDLDDGQSQRYKNIGYFVVCRDVEENEFGDGPTPDGMEALEWDMEVNDSHLSAEEDTLDDNVEQLNMFKWYASILNRTSIMLESPERDIGRLDRHGQSVLHYAVNSGNVDMVDYLITMFKQELNVNQTDACCFNPLHMAVLNCDVEMVRWLIKKGANANCIGGRQRQTPIHIAARNGCISIIKMLIEAGADVNSVDIEEMSVLTTAVRQGNEEVVKILLNKNARVNHEEAANVTALRLAVWSNNTKVVKLLLESGARLIHSHHLLHAAVSNNNLEVVKSLVSAGAAVNVRDDGGYTPLMIACSRKNIPITRFLLIHGVDVNAASHIDNKTALHICVQDIRESRSLNQLIELLVIHGADMNAPSHQGSVLFYSIILENRSAAAALVRHGADVNHRDDRAYVDNLSLAKRHGDLDLVKMLVYAGFRMAEMTWEPRALRTQSCDPACDFLIDSKTNALKLRELCRIVIRRKIGSKNLIARISALPLPTSINRYIALDIL